MGSSLQADLQTKALHERSQLQPGQAINADDQLVHQKFPEEGSLSAQDELQRLTGCAGLGAMSRLPRCGSCCPSGRIWQG